MQNSENRIQESEVISAIVARKDHAENAKKTLRPSGKKSSKKLYAEECAKKSIKEVEFVYKKFSSNFSASSASISAHSA